jgi:hypothetical protein
MSGQLHAPADLRPGKEPSPPTHCIGSWMGCRACLAKWRSEEIFPNLDSNSDPLVVQPVGFRYTDCAIPAHICCKLDGRRFESRMRLIFFNWPNPSSRTMVLGSTQPLTKMTTKTLPGSKKWPARRTDNLAAIYEPNVWKCGNLNLSQP